MEPNQGPSGSNNSLIWPASLLSGGEGTKVARKLGDQDVAWRGGQNRGWHTRQRERYASQVPDLYRERLSNQAVDEELGGQEKREDGEA